jgi:membrane glycosyltransferase
MSIGVVELSICVVLGLATCTLLFCWVTLPSVEKVKFWANLVGLVSLAVTRACSRLTVGTTPQALNKFT